ncbi:signal recognition particle-docking protein FtsY [Mesorhizobium sp. ANAO-SY3R2]|uniref:signal recognition particle-docking protein FtsY n=1 Tax=Mesorhizobium sp. ANAO-SY3R2 TaxID=3166644 RepID=UPI00366F33A1
MAFGFIKKVFSFGKKEEALESPSPLRGGSIDAVDRGGVAGSSDAAEALAATEAAAAVEMTPSGPSDHLPLKGGEEAAPVEPAPQPAPPEVPEPAPEKPAEQPVPEPTPSEPEPLPVEIPVTPAEPAEPDLPEEIPYEPELPQGEPTMREAEISLPLEGRVAAQRPGGDAESSDAAEEQEQEQEQVESTPSGPSDHLPLKGGEEVAPVAPAAKPAAGKVTVSSKVEQKAEVVEAAAPAPRLTWFQRLRLGLSRSSKELSGNIAGIFTKRKLDEDTLQDLEDVLIRADLGVETALRVTDALASSRYGKDVSDHEVRSIMAVEVEKVLGPVAKPLELDLSHKPHVILVVGVNGTGKTTTIGKLAAKLTEGGLSVMLAAGDTFRAAAIEQLKIWGERTKSPVIATKLGADAAGLAYDAFEKAKEAGSDVLIIDTAGRLQNKAELMAELEKIVRVLGKLDPEAPHTVLQTVDATTGQNALNQVEIFRNIAGVNGLVMTKLDGTARGGILVAIAAKHRLPVYFIGVGEQVDDLEPFSASDFAKAIAGVA